jgi:hypothetical protein
MDAQEALSEVKSQKREVNINNSSSDAVYGIGMIGAWIYFVGRETTWKGRALGVLKGFVWPAFMVYEVFNFLNRE